mmetsp:Transcript_13021/g.14426  ORF Transcript_13021/g.14426 Transcript_13021/m.14426 type:complete len:208 (-) Transcript_13021:180-803(-)
MFLCGPLASVCNAFQGVEYTEAVKQPVHTPWTLQSMPTELLNLIYAHADKEIYRLWPLLCHKFASSSRFNYTLDKHGDWKKWHKNGNIHVICPFKKGLNDGWMREWLLNGKFNGEILFSKGVATEIQFSTPPSCKKEEVDRSIVLDTDNDKKLINGYTISGHVKNLANHVAACVSMPEVAPEKWWQDFDRSIKEYFSGVPMSHRKSL